jgi:hypothetical protein
MPFKMRGVAKMVKSYKIEILAQEYIAEFWSTLSRVTLRYTRRDGQVEANCTASFTIKTKDCKCYPKRVSGSSIEELQNLYEPK